jgi:fructosamine-3-kinase
MRQIAIARPYAAEYAQQLWSSSRRNGPGVAVGSPASIGDGEMDHDIRVRLGEIFGAAPTDDVRLSGGSIADVRMVTFADNRKIVVKIGPPDGSLNSAMEQSDEGPVGLALEGWMLSELARRSSLMIPEVYYASERLLAMAVLPTGGHLDGAAQRQAADQIARLHKVFGTRFGYERDTLIGGLVQPNAWSGDWRSFFGEQRLMHMAEAAARDGALDPDTVARIERVAASLSRWIEPDTRPSLIHGDLWGGNILSTSVGAENDFKISGFIDPAIYFADREIELAFATLFDTFGAAFFERYNDHYPIEPGFFEIRRDLYNLYPLLVHVRLFGRAYLRQVETILTKLGA